MRPPSGAATGSRAPPLRCDAFNRIANQPSKGSMPAVRVNRCHRVPICTLRVWLRTTLIPATTKFRTRVHLMAQVRNVHNEVARFDYHNGPSFRRSKGDTIELLY